MIVRTITHSVILALLNLFAIVVGFATFKSVGGSNQIGIQAPIAFVISVVVFAIWAALVNARVPTRLRLRGWRDGGWVLVLASVVAAVVFVPVHYVTAGYLTAFSNILALWAFQIPTNAVAIAIGVTISGGKARRLNTTT
jgi:hypothetical protein